MSDGKLAAIVLAAGSSSRLGQPKQLVPFKGKPLLQHVLDELSAFQLPTYMVLGAHAEEIKTLINTEDIQSLENPQWETGMASSLKVGLEACLQENPNTENILFLLSDQPFVNFVLLDRLIQKHMENPLITGSEYKGQVGVPIIINKRFFPELLKLEGDRGAKKIIQQHPEHVQSIPFAMGHFDIDTKEDLENLWRL